METGERKEVLGVQSHRRKGRVSMVSLRLYCSCGAAWKGKLDRHGAKIIQDMWDATHRGNGHKPTTSQKAARQRYINDDPKIAG